MGKKILVSEFTLNNYDNLTLCCEQEFENTFYTSNYSLVDDAEYFKADFESIEDHDKELKMDISYKVLKWLQSQGFDTKEWEDLRDIIEED